MLLSPSATLDPKRTFLDTAPVWIAIKLSGLTGCKISRCFRTGSLDAWRRGRKPWKGKAMDVGTSKRGNHPHVQGCGHVGAWSSGSHSQSPVGHILLNWQLWVAVPGVRLGLHQACSFPGLTSDTCSVGVDASLDPACSPRSLSYWQLEVAMVIRGPCWHLLQPLRQRCSNDFTVTKW